MRILFDECVPRQLKPSLGDHEIQTVPRMGWSGIKNGRLLSLAIDAHFDILLTVDKSIPFQQNLSEKEIAIIVLLAPDTKFDSLKPLMPLVLEVVETIKPGEVVHIGG